MTDFNSLMKIRSYSLRRKMLRKSSKFVGTYLYDMSVVQVTFLFVTFDQSQSISYSAKNSKSKGNSKYLKTSKTKLGRLKTNEQTDRQEKTRNRDSQARQTTTTIKQKQKQKQTNKQINKQNRLINFPSVRTSFNFI